MARFYSATVDWFYSALDNAGNDLQNDGRTALVPGRLNENSLRNSSMGNRLLRVYRALLALALQAVTAQSFLFRRRFSGFDYCTATIGCSTALDWGTRVLPKTDAEQRALQWIASLPFTDVNTAQAAPESGLLALTA